MASTTDAESVDWPGVHVDVGTDRARLDLVSEQFIDAFERSPLAVEGTLRRSRGYAATPLTGVWANYPYLHNGSVPTLHHLLGPVHERPKIFEVMAASTLDRSHVGQPLTKENGRTRAKPSCCVASETTATGSTPRDLDRRTGDTTSGGRSRTDANRAALIEYLKTL